jgi:hypothetical protein
VRAVEIEKRGGRMLQAAGCSCRSQLESMAMKLCVRKAMASVVSHGQPDHRRTVQVVERCQRKEASCHQKQATYDAQKDSTAGKWRLLDLRRPMHAVCVSRL